MRSRAQRSNPSIDVDIYLSRISNKKMWYYGPAQNMDSTALPEICRRGRTDESRTREFHPKSGVILVAARTRILRETERPALLRGSALST